MQFRTLVTPLTGAFSALCSKPTPHQGNRSRRVVAALALSFLGLAAVAQPALAAATPRHTMQRFLMRGEKAAPTGTVTANAGTQYGLFSCQDAQDVLTFVGAGRPDDGPDADLVRVHVAAAAVHPARDRSRRRSARRTPARLSARPAA